MYKRRRETRSSSKNRVANRVVRPSFSTLYPQFEMLEPRWLLSGQPTIDLQEFVSVNDAQTVDFVWPGATVVGRHLFYNQSGTASPLRYDGNDAAINDHDDLAIATNKSAYLPGSGAAIFANVSSYTKGINGLMVDLQGTHGDIGVDDFEFYRGNNNSQTQWTAAPAPSSMSVRSGAGISGSDRVELVWGSDAVKKEWLLVIVRANDDTGLVQKAGWRLGIGDVFLFGNALGDSGQRDNAQFAFVNTTDEIAARNNPASVVSNIPITNLFDYNRDGAVNLADVLISQRRVERNVGDSHPECWGENRRLRRHGHGGLLSHGRDVRIHKRRSVADSAQTLDSQRRQADQWLRHGRPWGRGASAVCRGSGAKPIGADSLLRRDGCL